MQREGRLSCCHWMLSGAYSVRCVPRVEEDDLFLLPRFSCLGGRLGRELYVKLFEVYKDQGASGRPGCVILYSQRVEQWANLLLAVKECSIDRCFRTLRRVVYSLLPYNPSFVSGSLRFIVHQPCGAVAGGRSVSHRVSMASAPTHILVAHSAGL